MRVANLVRVLEVQAMKVLERGMVSVALMLALAAATQSVARAQYAPPGMSPAPGYAPGPGGPGFGPPPGGGPGGYMPYPGVMPASAMGPGGPMSPGGGNPGMEMAPGHYSGPAGGPPSMGPGGPMDGGGGGYGDGGDCPNCGGAGCAHCGGGCCGWLMGLCGFGEGYKCRPRYFDVAIDYMYFKREDVSRPVDLSPITSLSTNQLDFDGANGARVTLARMFAPGTQFEATYMGSFNWGTQFTDSVLGETLTYNSSLDSIELSIRQRWQEPECRYQTSWLAGFRYIRLDEDMTTVVTGTAKPAGRSTVYTNNDLYGAQIGGDFVIRPTGRLLLSAEGKVGLYGNSVTTETRTGGTASEVGGTQAAFVGEFNTNIVYHWTERFSIRGGYTLLYIDGVALAPENFNTAAPATALLNANGDVFLHGVNAGAEWTW